MSYMNARRVRPLNIRSLGQIPQGTMSDISNITQIVSSGLSTIIGAAQQTQQQAQTAPLAPAPTPALPSDLLAPATTSPSWVMPVVVTGGLVLVGGIAFMVMRKRAVKANRRRRMRRNGRRSRRMRGNSGRRSARPRASKLTARAAKRLLISRGVPMGRDVHELSFSQLNEVAAVARQAGYRKSKNAPGSTGRMYYQHLSRVRGNGRRSRRSLRRNTETGFLYYRGGRGYYRDASGKIKSTKLKPYEEHRGHGHSFHQYLRSTRAKGPSKKSGRFLEMNRLTARQRARIPLKAFVFPERRAWPINSSRRAYAATQMMRLGRVRSASDFNAIRNTIRTRYPKVWNLFGRSVTWDKTKAAKTRARRSSHRGRRSVGLAANRRSVYPTRRRRRSSFEKTAAKAIRGMGRRRSRR